MQKLQLVDDKDPLDLDPISARSMVQKNDEPCLCVAMLMLGITGFLRYSIPRSEAGANPTITPFPILGR